MSSPKSCRKWTYRSMKKGFQVISLHFPNWLCDNGPLQQVVPFFSTNNASEPCSPFKGIQSNQSVYRACRCKCSPRCDPDRCHRSDRGLKHTRWHPVHSAAQRSPEHNYRWRSHQCSHTDRRAHRGWYLRTNGKRVVVLGSREEESDDTGTYWLMFAHQCCIRLCRCCRCCPHIQQGSYSWTCHWWGWCHSENPLGMGC